MNDLFKRFIAYKTNVEGKSENSINQYIYRLTEFFNQFEINTVDKSISTTVDTVKQWLILLANKNNSPSTRNAKLTAVKEFYKFLKENEKINIDTDILTLKFAKVPKREAKFMDEETAVEFIESIGNLRTQACAVITFTTGLRYCELRDITVDDIKNGYANVIGKGNKERTVYFSAWCLKLVNKYINKKRKHIIERTGVKTNRLILSDEGNIMNDGHYNDSLKHYAEKCGIDWYSVLSSHKLRHSFATDKAVKGYDMATIRDALGHTNIATTNRYVHSQKERIKNMMIGE
jgi:site-specific recombinase XerD